MTYSVVAFMVKVRLVENKVKSHVGSVMLVKVTVQYSIVGTNLKAESSSMPISPNQDLGAMLYVAGTGADCEMFMSIEVGSMRPELEALSAMR